MLAYTFHRQLPLDASWDVIIVGGGPAGCTAAVAAAREGAKTLLLEATECLGGMSTSGLRLNGPTDPNAFCEAFCIVCVGYGVGTYGNLPHGVRITYGTLLLALSLCFTVIGVQSTAISAQATSPTQLAAQQFIYGTPIAYPAFTVETELTITADLDTLDGMWLNALK